MDFPSLTDLADGLAPDPFRIRQLITELLHLLPGVNTGHFRNVVVVQPLWMAINKVEDLFSIRFAHTRIITSKEL